MSMRDASRIRTICEVLREINDLIQGETVIEKTIRKKLAECEKMAKKMTAKLAEYNQDYYKEWWENNPDKKADLKKRLSENYITGE